jgi:hypothetical protein
MTGAASEIVLVDVNQKLAQAKAEGILALSEQRQVVCVGRSRADSSALAACETRPRWLA